MSAWRFKPSNQANIGAAFRGSIRQIWKRGHVKCLPFGPSQWQRRNRRHSGSCRRNELSPGFHPGFNPGNPQKKRFALKGQEMRVPDEARTGWPPKSQSAQLGPATIGPFGPRFRLLRTFDLAPPSGRAALGGRFPGLKPWAEFCSPFGAQNKGLSPKIVAYRFDICLLDFWLVNHYKLSIEIPYAVS